MRAICVWATKNQSYFSQDVLIDRYIGLNDSDQISSALATSIWTCRLSNSEFTSKRVPEKKNPKTKEFGMIYDYVRSCADIYLWIKSWTSNNCRQDKETKKAKLNETQRRKWYCKSKRRICKITTFSPVRNGVTSLLLISVNCAVRLFASQKIFNWRQKYITMQIFECVKIILTCILLFDLTFAEPLVNRFATRRKSVFAETYDPENDADEDEGAAAIFPKSDEQRARLIESVKNILLFRSLDKEQVRVPNVDLATVCKAAVCVWRGLAWRVCLSPNDTCVYSLI